MMRLVYESQYNNLIIMSLKLLICGVEHSLKYTYVNVYGLHPKLIPNITCFMTGEGYMIQNKQPNELFVH